MSDADFLRNICTLMGRSDDYDRLEAIAEKLDKQAELQELTRAELTRRESGPREERSF